MKTSSAVVAIVALALAHWCRGSSALPADSILYHTAVVPFDPSLSAEPIPANDPRAPGKKPESLDEIAKLRAERKERQREELLKFRQRETAIANRILAELSACSEIELITLDPDPQKAASPQRDTTRYTSNEMFAGGFKIVGRASTHDSLEIKNLAAALKRGFTESTNESGECFMPRHGLRFSNTGKDYLAVVCFECMQAYLCEIGNEKNHADLLIARTPEREFDAIFAKHGLKNTP